MSPLGHYVAILDHGWLAPVPFGHLPAGTMTVLLPRLTRTVGPVGRAAAGAAPTLGAGSLLLGEGMKRDWKRDTSPPVWKVVRPS